MVWELRNDDVELLHKIGSVSKIILSVSNNDYRCVEV